MTSARHTLFSLLAILLASGCSQRSLHSGQSSPSPLQYWIDTELVPYVSHQLGEHPRFKGEPVIIVRLDGDDIQPDIDGLTRSIRDQLTDGLLQTPGIHMPWQPQRRLEQHHRRLDQVQCGRVRDASYFVGVEIARTATTKFRVSVRALDVRAGAWVSGFSQQWSGSLNSSELRALQMRRSDESLRGLRVLPFSAGETDLAAAYLANNLSCLLRQQDEEELTVMVDEAVVDKPQLRTLLRLIGNNLSRYREVKISDGDRQANYVLRGESHMIQPGLYQVWVILQPKDSDVHLAGMDTAAYLRIPTDGNRVGNRGMVSERGGMRPTISRLELVRHTGTGDYKGRCNDGQRGCPLVEVKVEQTDELFVITHGIKDGISKLSGSCISDAPVRAYQNTYRYRFPEARFTATDWLTVYAIAVSGAERVRQFRHLMQELPDGCSNARGQLGATDRREHWLERLDHLVTVNHEHVVWMARRLP